MGLAGTFSLSYDGAIIQRALNKSLKQGMPGVSFATLPGLSWRKSRTGRMLREEWIRLEKTEESRGGEKLGFAAAKRPPGENHPPR